MITRVILRTRPRPGASQWFTSSLPPSAVDGALFAPTAIMRVGEVTAVLLEGNAADLHAQADVGSLTPSTAPALPTGAHRARISVDPAQLDTLLPQLDELEMLETLAEYGVGTVHVASDQPEMLTTARRMAENHGGWMLREFGAPDLDPFGVAMPADALQRRIRHSLDPTGKFSPGRVAATEPR